MSVNNLPSSTPGLFSPQILSALQTIIQDISTLIQPQPQGGLNMGPSTDMMMNPNNIFAGMLGPDGSPTPPSSKLSVVPQDPNSPGALPAAGGTTPPGTGTPPATPGTPSGGSDPEYVAMMNKALKANGAPDDLIQAYNEQYKLLGLTGNSGSVGAGASGPSGPGLGASGPVSGPSGPGASGPPSGASGASGPVGASGPSGASGPGGVSGPSGPITPSKTSGPAGSGGNNLGSPADAPPESPVFTNAGQVNWDKAPANLKALQKDIQKASTTTGVPESIIAGAIWQESGGNVKVAATDGGTDAGLMQIDNTTYSTYIAGKNGLPQSATTPTDAATNIMAGATYIKQLKTGPTPGLPGGGGFKTWDLALRAYNSGEFSGVDFSNPDKFGPAKRGDVNYLVSIRDHVKNLEAGTPPQPRG